MNDVKKDDIKVDGFAAGAVDSIDKSKNGNHASIEKIKKYLGIILLLATVIVVADRLGWYDFSVFAKAGGWRLTLAILLLLTGIGGIVQKEYGRFFVSAAIVVIMYRTILGLAGVSFWYILLVAAVLSVAFSLMNGWGAKSSIYSYVGDWRADDDETIRNITYDIFLGGGVKYLVAEKLRLARLRCRLGDMGVFFTHAKPESTEVEVNVKLVAGKMTLYIPNSAVVVSNLTLKAGEVKGISDAAKNNPDAVTYRLTGMVVWGTVEIEYV